MRERLSPLTLLTAIFRQNKIAPSLTIISIAFLLLFVNKGYCDGEVWVDGESNSGHQIQDESVKLPQQPILDFQGAGVTAANSGSKTVVTIEGGAGSGDVTSVGDCASGACLDGTSDGGTSLTFYHPSGAASLSYDATKHDFRLLDDLDIEDYTPHLNFRDTNSNVAYEWYLDSNSSEYPNFSLWRGTDDGTGFNVGGDNPPLLRFDNSNNFHLNAPNFTLSALLGSFDFNQTSSTGGEKIGLFIDYENQASSANIVNYQPIGLSVLTKSNTSNNQNAEDLQGIKSTVRTQGSGNHHLAYSLVGHNIFDGSGTIDYMADFHCNLPFLTGGGTATGVRGIDITPNVFEAWNGTISGDAIGLRIQSIKGDSNYASNVSGSIYAISQEGTDDINKFAGLIQYSNGLKDTSTSNHYVQLIKNDTDTGWYYDNDNGLLRFNWDNNTALQIVGTTRVDIGGGKTFRIQDAGWTDFLDISHDGTDAIMTGTNTGNLVISGMGLDAGGATSLEIPNGTSGTTDATGETYLDTNGDGGTNFSGEVLQMYMAAANKYLFPMALPLAASQDNYIPKYDASTKTISWEADAGGTITAADTQVIYSDGANNPVGDADFTWNKTTNSLTLANGTGSSIFNGNLEMALNQKIGFQYYELVKYLGYNTTSHDFYLTDDLDVEDQHPHIGARDTDDNSAYQWHFDSADASYPGLALFHGTNDGTNGFKIGTANAGYPSIHINTSYNVNFPRGFIFAPNLSTTTTEGKTYWNTSLDELHIGDGANDVVIAAKTKSRSFVIKTPVVADDFPLWKTPRAITITGIKAIATGGTNVVGGLWEYASDWTTSQAQIDSGDWTITTSAFSDTTISTNSYLDAGDVLWWITTTVSGTVNFLTVTVEYYES